VALSLKELGEKLEIGEVVVGDENRRRKGALVRQASLVLKNQREIVRLLMYLDIEPVAHLRYELEFYTG
jgi:hypothetical protein